MVSSSLTSQLVRLIIRFTCLFLNPSRFPPRFPLFNCLVILSQYQNRDAYEGTNVRLFLLSLRHFISLAMFLKPQTFGTFNSIIIIIIKDGVILFNFAVVSST